MRRRAAWILRASWASRRALRRSRARISYSVGGCVICARPARFAGLQRIPAVNPSSAPTALEASGGPRPRPFRAAQSTATVSHRRTQKCSPTPGLRPGASRLRQAGSTGSSLIFWWHQMSAPAASKTDRERQFRPPWIIRTIAVLRAMTRNYVCNVCVSERTRAVSVPSQGLGVRWS